MASVPPGSEGLPGSSNQPAPPSDPASRLREAFATFNQLGTRSIARPDPAPWTRVYWPLSVTASVLGYVLVDLLAPQYRGYALTASAVILLVPELYSIITRHDENTLSDWTWRVLDVTRNQPVSQWGASHFLALSCYLVVASRVLVFLWQNDTYWLAGASTAVAAWLIPHLFGGWWR